MFAMLMVVIIAFLIFDLYQRFYRPLAATKNWPNLAERTGLQFHPPGGPWSNRSPARVIGNYRGYEVKLDTTRQLAGPVDDGIATYRTRWVLTMNQPVNGSLWLKRRWFSGWGILRAEEQTVGDAQFDQRFIIRSHPQDLAARLFAAPELRHRFLAETTLREFSLSNLGVRFEMAGIEGNPKKLHAQLNLVADVVQTVKRLE